MKRPLRGAIARRVLDRLRVSGYAAYQSGPRRGRALLSYLPHPLLIPPRARTRKKFSNLGIAEELPRVLNELGFVVDIVSFENRSWRPQGHYDLFIGHPGSNFLRFAEEVGPSCTKLLFVTGAYWRESNRLLMERMAELTRRRGHILDSPRCVEREEDSALKVADGVICIGNEDTAATYPEDVRPLPVINAVYPVTWTQWRDRDYEHARRNFLFFAGPGPLLKGLDLVIEAFLESPHELHVCQRYHRDFLRIYGPVLASAGNIRVYGEVPMRGTIFKRLARKCAWVISATAAEGQPGALLECMAHGMIPMVPRSANLGTDGVCLLPSVDVATLRGQIEAAVATPPDVCARTAEEVASLVVTNHSVHSFRQSLKRAVTELLDEQPPPSEVPTRA